MKGSNFIPLNFFFIVKIGGTELAFSAVDGLDTELEVEEVLEGGRNDYVHRLPKQVKYGNVKLKRGMEIDGSDKLSKGLKDFLTSPKPFSGQNFSNVVGDVIIQLLNPRKQKRKSKTIKSKAPLVQWTLTKAYPIKWNIGNLDSLDEAVLYEEIELTFSSMSVEYLFGSSQDTAPTGKSSTNTDQTASKEAAGKKGLLSKLKAKKDKLSKSVKDSSLVKKAKKMSDKVNDLKDKAEDAMSKVKANVGKATSALRKVRGKLKKIQRIADGGIEGQLRKLGRATGMTGLLRQVDGLSKQTKNTTQSVNKSIFSIEEQIEDVKSGIQERLQKYKKNAEETGEALTEADKPEDVKESEKEVAKAEETRDALEEQVLELEDAMETLEKQKEAVEQQIAEMENSETNEEDEEKEDDDSEEESSEDEDDDAT